MTHPSALMGVVDKMGRQYIVAVIIDDNIVHEIFDTESYMATADFETLGEVIQFLNFDYTE